MWTAVTPVLVVLITAAIGIGSRPTRWRRRIAQDLELLEKLRNVFPEASNLWDLENRIDIDLWQYAVLDTKTREQKALRRRTTLRRFVVHAAFTFVALIGVLAAAALAGLVAEQLTGASSNDEQSIQTWVTVVVSFVGTLAALSASERLVRRRLSPGPGKAGE